MVTFQFIRASSLEGPFVRLKVENSDIRAKSIHSEHFLIQGQRGSFRLKELRGHGLGKENLPTLGVFAKFFSLSLVDLNSGAIKIGG